MWLLIYAIKVYDQKTTQLLISSHCFMEKTTEIKAPRKPFSILKLFIIIAILCIIVGSVIAFSYYRMIFKPNVQITDSKSEYFYILTGSEYDDVEASLFNKSYIADEKSFEWVAEKKNLKNHIHPGRYKLNDGMNNNELVNLLRSGQQSPVKVTFNNIRTKKELASKISKQIEADSTAILDLLNDGEFLKKYNMTTQNVMIVFIPNTYEYYWNTSSLSMADRLFCLWHYRVICRNNDYRNICYLCSSGTHGCKRLVTWSI